MKYTPPETWWNGQHGVAQGVTHQSIRSNPEIQAGAKKQMAHRNVENVEVALCTWKVQLISSGIGWLLRVVAILATKVAGNFSPATRKKQGQDLKNWSAYKEVAHAWMANRCKPACCLKEFVETALIRPKGAVSVGLCSTTIFVRSDFTGPVLQKNAWKMQTVRGLWKDFHPTVRSFQWKEKCKSTNSFRAMTLERSGWRLCVVKRNPEAKKPRAIAVGFFWFLHVEQKNACEYII